MWSFLSAYKSPGITSTLNKEKGSMGFGVNFNEVDSWGHRLMALVKTVPAPLILRVLRICKTGTAKHDTQECYKD